MNTLSNVWKTNRKITAVVLIVFFTAIITIEMFVHYYGDDYYFLTFLQGDFWKMHLFHYMHNNGRSIVHFLVTVFLYLDIHLWYTANALFLTLTAYFISKLMGGRCLPAFISCAMILTMPVSLTHESVFWITGSLNYVYPSMLSVIYWYILSTRDKHHAAAMYIVVFLLSASTEQGAVTAVAITVCYTAFGLFVEHTDSKRLIAALVIAVAGAVTVFFAPGNIERMATEGVGESYTTIIKSIGFLMRNVFAADYTVLFNAAAIFVSSVYLYKRGYNKIPWICAVLLILMIVENRIFHIQYITKFLYWPVTVSVCIGCTGLYIFTALKYYEKTKSIKPAIAVAVGICSCAFIIPSPTVGPRLLYMTDILFIIYICCIAANALRYKRLLIIFAVIISAAAAYNWFITLHGYYVNNEIYYENEKMLEIYKQYPSDILIQKKLISEDYGWSMPYNSPYHEYYYKLYNDIPDKTRILWK